MVGPDLAVVHVAADVHADGVEDHEEIEREHGSPESAFVASRWRVCRGQTRFEGQTEAATRGT